MKRKPKEWTRRRYDAELRGLLSSDSSEKEEEDEQKVVGQQELVE
jgi:hypothetical protein